MLRSVSGYYDEYTEEVIGLFYDVEDARKEAYNNLSDREYIEWTKAADGSNSGVVYTDRIGYYDGIESFVIDGWEVRGNSDSRRNEDTGIISVVSHDD